MYSVEVLDYFQRNMPTLAIPLKSFYYSILPVQPLTSLFASFL